MEYTELGSLLVSQDLQGSNSNTLESEAQDKDSQNRGKVPPVTNLITWLEAYSKFMAVLLGNENTSKEEGCWLATHLHTILQLHQDLGGTSD